MSKCSHKNIINAINQCQFVQENCEAAFIDFYYMNYCIFENNLYVSMPIFILIWIISFYLLSDTANKYLSSALTTLAERLNISQNLAGVTFLAFGNGAPDIISSFVASDSSDSGIDFSVGALVGSGVFITSFVVSSVLFYAKSVGVKRDMFIRDIIIYLLTLTLLMIFSIDGKISIWETICFFIVYSVYIIIAFIQDRRTKKKKEENNEKLEEEETNNEIYFINESGNIIKNEKEEKGIDESMVSFKSSNDSFKENNNNTASKEEIQKNEGTDQKEEIKNSAEDEDNIIKDLEQNKELPKNALIKTIIKKKTLLNEEYFYEDNHNIEINNSLLNNKKVIRFKRQSTLEFQLDSIKYKMKKLFFTSDYSKKNIIQKIFYFIVELPFNILRDLSIPPCEKENWKQQFFIIMPLGISLFIIISFKRKILLMKEWGFIIEYYYVSIAILVLVLLMIISFYYTTYRTRPPKTVILLCIGSFIMSILWIYFIAKVLLDILNIVGDILNIPDVFLGMTLLAIGNSAPDLSLNCALAKSGFGEMGISGSIAGPLFNLLIGLGSSVFKLTLQSDDYSIEFELFDKKNILILISIVFLMINLIRMLIQAFILKFKLNLSVSYAGYGIYLIFFLIILYLSFIQGNV